MKGFDYFSTPYKNNIKTFENFPREFASFEAKLAPETYMKSLSLFFLIVIISLVFCLTHK